MSENPFFIEFRCFYVKISTFFLMKTRAKYVYNSRYAIPSQSRESFIGIQLSINCLGKPCLSLYLHSIRYYPT